jgi:hypothetical protein
MYEYAAHDDDVMEPHLLALQIPVEGRDYIEINHI